MADVLLSGVLDRARFLGLGRLNPSLTGRPFLALQRAHDRHVLALAVPCRALRKKSKLRARAQPPHRGAASKKIKGPMSAKRKVPSGRVGGSSTSSSRPDQGEAQRGTAASSLRCNNLFPRPSGLQPSGNRLQMDSMTVREAVARHLEPLVATSLRLHTQRGGSHRDVLRGDVAGGRGGRAPRAVPQATAGRAGAPGSAPVCVLRKDDLIIC